MFYADASSLNTSSCILKGFKMSQIGCLVPQHEGTTNEFLHEISGRTNTNLGKPAEERNEPLCLLNICIRHPQDRAQSLDLDLLSTVLLASD